MKLTGKCVEDFLVYIYYREDTNQASDESKRELLVHHANKWIDRQDGRFVDRLIIDWFDSIGIYIGILICIDETFDSYILHNDVRTECTQFQETRQKAVNEAIVKANELYNGK